MKEESLLDLIHNDVYGPFKTTIIHGERYLVTFTDDYRYGYAYLIKHNSKTFVVFRTFQKIDNQLGKMIKIL